MGQLDIYRCEDCGFEFEQASGSLAGFVKIQIPDSLPSPVVNSGFNNFTSSSQVMPT